MGIGLNLGIDLGNTLGMSGLPLLLAKSPAWEPSEDWVARAKAKTPNNSFFAIALLGSGALGVVIAVTAYRLSRWQATSALDKIAARRANAQVAPHESEELSPASLQALKQLAEED